MPIVGPMLATLASMSPCGQMPLSCRADTQGVSAVLGERVQLFVGLRQNCELGGENALDSAETSGILSVLLDEFDAAAPRANAETDDADSDQPDLSAPLEPQEALHPEEADGISVEPDAPVESAAVPAEIAASPWVDPEEAVTRRQIADAQEWELKADSLDPESAPVAGSQSASVDEIAPADDSAPVLDNEPSPDVPAGDAAPADPDSVTGPGLVRAAGRLWLERFAQVRNQVRKAF